MLMDVKHVKQCTSNTTKRNPPQVQLNFYLFFICMVVGKTTSHDLQFFKFSDFDVLAILFYVTRGYITVARKLLECDWRLFLLPFPPTPWILSDQFVKVSSNSVA